MLTTSSNIVGRDMTAQMEAETGHVDPEVPVVPGKHRTSACMLHWECLFVYVYIYIYIYIHTCPFENGTYHLPCGERYNLFREALNN